LRLGSETEPKLCGYFDPLKGSQKVQAPLCIQPHVCDHHLLTSSWSQIFFGPGSA